MSKNQTFKRIRNSAVIKNPLLFEAIGLCPVVAIATSLRLSIFLAVVTAIEMIVCEVLASLLLKMSVVIGELCYMQSLVLR